MYNNRLFIKCFVLCVVFVILSTALRAQVPSSGITIQKYTHVAPVGEVPSYVKEKGDFSPEVYSMLEAINRAHKVNYSALFEETFPFKKESLIGIIKATYWELQKGQLKEELFGVVNLSAPSPEIKEDVLWQPEMIYQIDDSLQFGRQRGIVYTPEDGAEGTQLQLEVCYVLDSSKGSVHVVKKELTPVGACGVDMPCMMFSYVFSPSQNTESIYGEYGCNFTYTTTSGESKTVPLCMGLLIPIGHISADISELTSCQ